MDQENGLSSRDQLLQDYVEKHGVDKPTYMIFENRYGTVMSLVGQNHLKPAIRPSLEFAQKRLHEIEKSIQERSNDPEILRKYVRLYTDRNPSWVVEPEPATAEYERISAPIDGNDDELERWKDEARRSRIEG